MLVYWLLFLYFAVGALREEPRPAAAARVDVLFRLGFFFMALLIGLRFRVGADWITYEYLFADAKQETMGALPAIADPGYYLVNIGVQWFDAEAPDPAPAPVFRMKPTRFGIHGEMLAVDTSRFGVEDVAGAVRLSCDLLGLDGEPIAYDVVTPDPHRSAQQRAASSSARLRHRLRGVPAAVPARVRRVLGRASSSR